MNDYLYLVTDYLLHGAKRTTIFNRLPPKQGLTVIDYSKHRDVPEIICYNSTDPDDYSVLVTPSIDSFTLCMEIPCYFSRSIPPPKSKNRSMKAATDDISEDIRDRFNYSLYSNPQLYQHRNRKNIVLQYHSHMYAWDNYYMASDPMLVDLVKDRRVVYFDKFGDARYRHDATLVGSLGKGPTTVSGSQEAFKRAMRGV